MPTWPMCYLAVNGVPTRGGERKQISPSEFALAPQHSETQDRVCPSQE